MGVAIGLVAVVASGGPAGAVSCLRRAVAAADSGTGRAPTTGGGGIAGLHPAVAEGAGRGVTCNCLGRERVGFGGAARGNRALQRRRGEGDLWTLRRCRGARATGGEGTGIRGAEGCPRRPGERCDGRLVYRHPADADSTDGEGARLRNRQVDGNAVCRDLARAQRARGDRGGGGQPHHGAHGEGQRQPRAGKEQSGRRPLRDIGRVRIGRNLGTTFRTHRHTLPGPASSDHLSRMFGEGSRLLFGTRKSAAPRNDTADRSPTAGSVSARSGDGCSF